MVYRVSKRTGIKDHVQLRFLGVTVQDEQAAICRRYACKFVASSTESKTGLAIQTLGLRPLHGLRHPPTDGATGWYIWAGELSVEADFFFPIHTSHLTEKLPQVVKFLGLPPGSRFLLDGDYVDVWFDETLLKV